MSKWPVSIQESSISDLGIAKICTKCSTASLEVTGPCCFSSTYRPIQQKTQLAQLMHSFFLHFIILQQVHSLFPNPVLHTMRSRASFNFQYPLFSLTSPNICIHLLTCLPVTSILPSIFPSITCSRRQFLRKMWPIQLAFLLFIVCRIFTSCWALCNTSPFLTGSVQLIFSIHLQNHISELSRYFWSTFRSVQVSAPHRVIFPMKHFTHDFLAFKSNFLVKKTSCWLQQLLPRQSWI